MFNYVFFALIMCLMLFKHINGLSPLENETSFDSKGSKYSDLDIINADDNMVSDVTNSIDEYEDLQDMIGKVNMETLQGSPWFLFLLASKPPKPQSRFLTPRLGRNARQDANEGGQRSRPPFAPRLGKKSLPFSPRLGRSFYNRNFNKD